MITFAPNVPAIGSGWDGGEEISAVRQLALLAPTPQVFSRDFGKVEVDASQYSDLMVQMQRLRGSVYFQDGALQRSDLDDTGRHVMAVDAESFHLLALSQSGQVLGCCRFNPHRADVAFEKLAVSRAPIAEDPLFGTAFRRALQDQLTSAHERGYWYVEVGGWALHPALRHSTEAIRIALLNFSLGLALGGAVGISTATTRNRSAAILRRIGGRPLSYQGFQVPQYYDARYGCDIEVVTFDSDLIPDRYAQRIEQLRQALYSTKVYCYQTAAAETLCNLLYALQGSNAPLLELAAA
jgi:hypothetical protein